MSADIYEKAYEHLPLPVFIEQDGFFSYVNRKMVEISGYSRETLLKKPCMELLFPGYRGMAENNAFLKVCGGKDPEDCLFNVFNSQGEVVYLNGFFTGIEYNGRPASLGQFFKGTIGSFARKIGSTSHICCMLSLNNTNM